MNELAAIPASSIVAVGGIIKDLLGGSVINVTLILIACVVIAMIKKNSKITLFNSEEHKNTRKALLKHEIAMQALEAQLKRSEASLNNSIATTTGELRFELEKVKGIVSTASVTAAQELSRIPKVEEAIEAVRIKNEANEKNIQIILTGLRNLKK